MRASRVTLFHVTVLGATGGIGQPLSLLLKNSPLVTELKLYDIRGAPGVAADLSHIAAPARVTGYDASEIGDALSGAEVVLISAGVSGKPVTTREDLFTTTAKIVSELVAAVGQHAPKAVIGIISNPVNSNIAVAANTLTKMGVYDPALLFGVTTLDVVRARTFTSKALNMSPYDIDVPVIGGHSADTIIPLLSRFPNLTEEQVKSLTNRIQCAGYDVVKAKGGAGSATLSMAYAASEWTFAILKALRGDKGIVEYTMVESPLHQPSCRWFSSAVELGRYGADLVLPLPMLSAFEESVVSVAVEKLVVEQKKGLDFVNI